MTRDGVRTGMSVPRPHVDLIAKGLAAIEAA